MFDFIRSQPAVLDRILRHIEIPAFVDLIFRLIQLEELPGAAGVIEVQPPPHPTSSHCSSKHLSLQWLSQEQLILKLASMLSPQNPPDLHIIVSDMLKGIIALCAPSPGGANDQMALVANRFSRQLASQSIADLLVSYIFDEPTGRPPFVKSTPSRPTLTTSLSARSIGLNPANESHSWRGGSTTDEEDDDDRSSHSESSSSSSSDYHSFISKIVLSSSVLSSALIPIRSRFEFSCGKNCC